MYATVKKKAKKLPEYKNKMVERGSFANDARRGKSWVINEPYRCSEMTKLLVLMILKVIQPGSTKSIRCLYRTKEAINKTKRTIIETL